MKLFNPHSHLVAAIVLGLTIPSVAVLGWQINTRSHVASNPSTSGASQGTIGDRIMRSASSVSPTPAPTVLAATPAPVAPTIALISCTVWGSTYQMTQKECDLSQLVQRQSEARLQQQREASKLITLDYKITPPPTGGLLLPTASPITCDYAAKSAIDSTFQHETASLYQDYQSAVGQILASGSVDSSAPQAAYSAYITQKSRLERDYASQLTAIHCP